MLLLLVPVVRLSARDIDWADDVDMEGVLGSDLGEAVRDGCRGFGFVKERREAKSDEFEGLCFGVCVGSASRKRDMR